MGGVRGAGTGVADGTAGSSLFEDRRFRCFGLWGNMLG
jgi:hypothetical protein